MSQYEREIYKGILQTQYSIIGEQTSEVIDIVDKD